MSLESLKYYPPSESQGFFFTLLEYTPYKELLQLPFTFVLQEPVDFDILKKAMNIEIERNDCLRLCFEKKEKSYVQCFLPQRPLDDIEIIDFRGKTQKQQDAYFSKDAKKPIRYLKDEIYRIKFFHTHDGRSGLYFNAIHMIIDGYGLNVMLADLFKVYRALKEGTDLPPPLVPFEEVLKKELEYKTNEKQQKKDMEFFAQFLTEHGEAVYAGVHGPELLEKQRKKTKNPAKRSLHFNYFLFNKTGIVNEKMDTALYQKLKAFCAERAISVQNLIQLVYRTHLSKVNNGETDISFDVFCDRRPTLAQRNTSGCLTQSVPFRTVISNESTVPQALDEIATVLQRLYHHTQHPHLRSWGIAKKLYGTGSGNLDLYTAMQFSFVDLPPMREGFPKIETKWVSPGRFLVALYPQVLPDLMEEGLVFNYEYRRQFVTQEHVQAMHRASMRMLEKIIEKPDITIAELQKVAY